MAADPAAPPTPSTTPASAHDVAVDAAASAAAASPHIPVVPSLLDDDDVPRFQHGDRLKASPLSDWFPGAEWKILLVWLDGVAVQSIEPPGLLPITLIIEGVNGPADIVRYTTSEKWADGEIGRYGPVVSSAAQIGELMTSGA